MTLFTGIALLCSACPVKTAYPLFERPSEPVDSALFGTWINPDTGAYLRKLSISRLSDSSYLVNALETGSKFDAPSTSMQAWTGKLFEKNFLIIASGEPTARAYYLYHFRKISSKTIRTFDVCLEGGPKEISSSHVFRERLKKSLEDSTCIMAPIDWQKAD